MNVVHISVSQHCKMTSLAHISADWPPSYHFPHHISKSLHAARLDELADSNEPAIKLKSEKRAEYISLSVWSRSLRLVWSHPFRHVVLIILYLFVSLVPLCRRLFSRVNIQPFIHSRVIPFNPPDQMVCVVF